MVEAAQVSPALKTLVLYCVVAEGVFYGFTRKSVLVTVLFGALDLNVKLAQNRSQNPSVNEVSIEMHQELFRN